MNRVARSWARLAIVLLSPAFITIQLSAESAISGVTEVSESEVHLQTYQLESTITVTLDNLELWTEEDGAIPLERRIFSGTDPVRIRHAILSGGFARVVDEAQATQDELTAQSEAMKNSSGLWAAVEPTVDTIQPDDAGEDAGQDTWWHRAGDWITDTARQLWNWLSTFWLWLFTGGFIAALAGAAWKWSQKKRAEKRIRASLLGDPGTGKTALSQAWADSGLSEAHLSALSPTATTSLIQHTTPIRAGEFSIYLNVADIPGSQPGGVLDHTRKRFGRQLLIITLAPTTKNSATIGDAASFDESFISEQLGGIRSLARAIISSKGTRGLSGVFVFVTKFDLYSRYPATDSAARETRTLFENRFKRHLQVVAHSCKERKVPFKYTIGSPPKRWGIDDLESFLKKEVFDK